MAWFLIVLYALHVICAILWFGGGLSNVLITGPALQRVSEGARAEIGFQMAQIAGKVYPVAAAATIVLGVLLAYLGGRVSSLEGLASPYGITAGVALALATGLWFWGERVIGPSMRRMQAAPPEQRPGLLKAALRNVALEQFAFVVVVGCMVLLRFGW
ncbi:MAG TPA: hypothetical protein VGD09_17405 [Blastococcus sp.]